MIYTSRPIFTKFSIVFFCSLFNKNGCKIFKPSIFSKNLLIEIDEVFKLLEKSVLIYEGGGVERGAKEYSSHHLLADMAFMSKMEVELIELQVKIYNNIAISSSRSIIKGKYKGKAIEKTNMETIVLKKSNGKWKIINIHWS